MKGYSSLVRFKFRAGILLGFLATVAILATDVSAVSYRTYEPTQVQADGDKDNGEQHATEISAGKNLVASVSQLTIDQAWHFIADLYFDNHEDQDNAGLDIREYNTWFKTLFRIIISPNAP